MKKQTRKKSARSQTRSRSRSPSRSRSRSRSRSPPGGYYHTPADYFTKFDHTLMGVLADEIERDWPSSPHRCTRVRNRPVRYIID